MEKELSKKIDDDITVLKGIGDKSKLMYNKLGIFKVIDFLHYFPKRYEENSGIIKISDLEPNKISILELKVISIGKLIRAKKFSILNVIASDDINEIKLVFYNQPYLQRSLYAGKNIIIKGKLSIKNGSFQIISPNFLGEKEYELIQNQLFIPVYPLTKKITNKKLILNIDLSFRYIGDRLEEIFPKEILEKYNLLPYDIALKKIHFPKSTEDIEISRKRFIFEEFLYFSLDLSKIKKDNLKIKNAFKIRDKGIKENFLLSLPFKLSKSQERVISEIEKDIFSQYTMNRLVQGDVGSGKTVIAALAILDVIKNSYQAVVMAPTEVLAKQHFKTLAAFFSKFDVSIELLTSSVKKSEKTRIKDDLSTGKVELLIATHAVLTEDTIFKNLALVVCDEQHRFGVSQREKLISKGDKPHTLVMSATPIPRTLALILYSDMDLSINEDMPNGRLPIKTYFVDSSFRKRIYKFIEKELKLGNQCYVVCAKAEYDEESELLDVETYKNLMQDFYSEDITISFLHGKMKNKLKNRIMQDFVDKKIDILVSTTVIEVGIDVKDATCIIIENAERFGLSQLHQLRGRVGRSDKQSYCILLSDSDKEETKQRLNIMCESNDGFEIAKKDLFLRGHGDLLGIKQAGLPTFTLGNIYDDADVLDTTKKLADFLIFNDEIEKIEYNLLKERLKIYLNNLEGFTL